MAVSRQPVVIGQPPAGQHSPTFFQPPPQPINRGPGQVVHVNQQPAQQYVGSGPGCPCRIL